MNLGKYLMRYLARLISSDLATQLFNSYWRIRQLSSSNKPEVAVWLRADDPYSYLLVQVLPELQRRFDVSWQLYVTSTLQQDMYPEAEMWQNNAWQDISFLAQLYQIKPAKHQPNLGNISSSLTASLLNLQQNGPIEWRQIQQLFNAVWQQGKETKTTLTAEQLSLLKSNETILKQQGHYLTATLKFQGQWFWGLDRLDHFEQRLNKLALNTDKGNILFNQTYCNFCRPFAKESVIPENKPQPLVLYFSIRSPYSHLALERCIELTAHYGIPLLIKPIIPMVMRGLQVPKTKKLYIFRDTKREANKLGIPYGFVADPLGEGVNRCYALFEYAQQQNKEIEYLLNYSRAVNAQGIMSETDKGLKMIVERSGLQWSKAKAILKQENCNKKWQTWAEQNQTELQQLGHWGVPTLKYDNTVAWGQDRIWLIENAIRQHILA